MTFQFRENIEETRRLKDNFEAYSSARNRVDSSLVECIGSPWLLIAGTDVPNPDYCPDFYQGVIDAKTSKDSLNNNFTRIIDAETIL